jgi:hypothetical protein
MDFTARVAIALAGPLDGAMHGSVSTMLVTVKSTPSASQDVPSPPKSRPWVVESVHSK